MEPQPGSVMSRETFRAWAAEQPGRWERLDGQPMAMAAERVVHARLKARMWRALDDAIAEAGLPCEALPDGVTIEVGEDSDFEPDALVTCGPPLDDDEIAARDAVIVVEALSPGSRSIDSVTKLEGYFRVPTIRHYLIVEPRRRAVIHHRRGEGETLTTSIVHQGEIVLDPPGLRLSVTALFRHAPSS